MLTPINQDDAWLFRNRLEARSGLLRDKLLELAEAAKIAGKGEGVFEFGTPSYLAVHESDALPIHLLSLAVELGRFDLIDVDAAKASEFRHRAVLCRAVHTYDAAVARLPASTTGTPGTGPTIRAGTRYFTGSANAVSARARAEVRALGSYASPLDPVNVAATSTLDLLTRQAGLTGGWEALYAVAVSTGKRIPGHRNVAGRSPDTGQQMPHVVFGYSQSMEDILAIRAYALEFAPELIDPNAAQPNGATWW